MTITRERLIAKLEKAYPEMMLRDSELFDGRKGAIWTSGEEPPLDRTGMPIFDYWAEDIEEKYYTFGVRNHLFNFLERNGWYAEWYDAGTIFIYEI